MRGHGERFLSDAPLLPNNFLRILVFPDSEKDRLAEPINPRPLRKFDITDNHPFNPDAPFHFGGRQPLIQAGTGCG